MEPEEQRNYVEIEDPKIRAGVIAHAIRVSGGKVPAVGEVIGFAVQLKEVEAPDMSAAVQRLNEATNRSEKIWCSMTVTEEDLQMGWELVRSETFVAHPGKHSSLPWKLK